MSTEGMPPEEENITETQQSVEPLETLEESEEFQELNEQIKNLSPQVEGLMIDLKKLEQAKGKAFIKNLLFGVGIPLVTGIGLWFGGVAIEYQGLEPFNALLTELGRFAEFVGVSLAVVGGPYAGIVDATKSSESYSDQIKRKKEILSNFESVVEQARALTTQALVEGGAEYETVENPDGDGTHEELRATPEQVEYSRKEAERDGVDIVRPENMKE